MTAVNDGTRNQVNAIFQDYCCLQDLRIERIWYSGQENGDCIMLNGLGRGQVAQWARGITIRDVYALNGGGSVCCYFNANDTGSKLSGIEIQNIYSYVSADVEDDRVVISANFPSGSTGNYAYLRDVTIRDIFVDVASGSSGTVNGVKLDTGAYGQIQNVLISGVHYYALASGGAIGNPVIMYSAGTGGATGYLQDYVVENVFAQNSYGVELFLNRFTTAPQVTVRNVVMENCRDPLYLVSLQTQSTATGDEIVTFDSVSGNSVTSPGTYVPMGIQLWSGSSAKGASGAVLARGLMFTGVTYGITSTVNGSGNGTAATAYSKIVVRDSNLSGATTPVSLANTYTVSSVTGVTFGEISAKAYGATGNGSTDDTAALTAWINAVNAAANGARVPARRRLHRLLGTALNHERRHDDLRCRLGPGQRHSRVHDQCHGRLQRRPGPHPGGRGHPAGETQRHRQQPRCDADRGRREQLPAAVHGHARLQQRVRHHPRRGSVRDARHQLDGQNVTVTLSGGTVTAVVVNSLTVATATSSTVVDPAGQTITLTYSAAPTWTWTGYGTCLDVWPNGTSMWAHNIRLEGINTPSCAIQVNATDAVLTGVKPASCTWGIMLLSGASGAQVEASHMSPGGPNCIWVNGNPGEVLISGNRFDAYTSSAVQLTPPTSIPFDITITGNDFYSTVMTDDAYALIGVDTTLAGIRNLKITNNGGWAASSNRPAYGVSAQTQADLGIQLRAARVAGDDRHRQLLVDRVRPVRHRHREQRARQLHHHERVNVRPGRRRLRLPGLPARQRHREHRSLTHAHRVVGRGADRYAERGDGDLGVREPDVNGRVDCDPDPVPGRDRGPGRRVASVGAVAGRRHDAHPVHGGERHGRAHVHDAERRHHLVRVRGRTQLPAVTPVLRCNFGFAGATADSDAFCLFVSGQFHDVSNARYCSLAGAPRSSRTFSRCEGCLWLTTM